MFLESTLGVRVTWLGSFHPRHQAKENVQENVSWVQKFKRGSKGQDSRGRKSRQGTPRKRNTCASSIPFPYLSVLSTSVYFSSVLIRGITDAQASFLGTFYTLFHSFTEPISQFNYQQNMMLVKPEPRAQDPRLPAAQLHLQSSHLRVASDFRPWLIIHPWTVVPSLLQNFQQ